MRGINFIIMNLILYRHLECFALVVPAVRLQFGPDNDAVFMIGRFIAQIYDGSIHGRQPKPKTSRGKRSVKATLKNGGASFRVSLDKVEEEA
jgi:hypothetical protein